LKEIEGVDTWKDITFTNRKTNLSKMSVFPYLTYKFNAIPTKIQTNYLKDNGRLILRFIWRGKRLRIVNIILKKNKLRGI
jgi:hypothetical protein